MNNNYKEFEKKTKSRPHVVVLGAGASLATIPNGDKNKLAISCMDNFIENLGLKHLLDGIKLETKSNNLEDIYSELDEKSKTDNCYQGVKKKLEDAVFDLFDKYEIPDEPTIYDYLLLGLREKDLIASFNWDPLLIQAGNRLIEKRIVPKEKLPKVLFLHGNVGLCYDPKLNRSSLFSHHCQEYPKSKLLFPVKNKDYTSDLIISESWKMFEDYLSCAYVLTIFGFGCSESDVKAFELMKSAWTRFSKKELEQIEIIDLKDESIIRKRWNQFIYDGHYDCVKDFSDSMIFRCPRRTCECLFDVSMNSFWGNLKRGFKKGMPFESLKEKIEPLLFDEYFNDGMLFNPYLECMKYEDGKTPERWKEFLEE